MLTWPGAMPVTVTPPWGEGLRLGSMGNSTLALALGAQGLCPGSSWREEQSFSLLGALPIYRLFSLSHKPPGL